jgi:hypothetical protein
MERLVKVGSNILGAAVRRYFEVEAAHAIHAYVPSFAVSALPLPGGGLWSMGEECQWRHDAVKRAWSGDETVQRLQQAAPARGRS